MFLTDEIREARAQHTALRDLVGRLQPEEVVLRDAPVLYDEFAAIARLANGAMTLLADRVAESDVWKQAGSPTPADYLANKNGTTARSGRNALKTSKRLRGLPGTRAAVQRGELSGEQADLIADAAARNPDAEADLLDLAPKASFSELKQECLRRKAAADRDRDETGKRLHRERKLRMHTDAEGAWNLYGRGAPVVGARVGKALDLITDKLFRQARQEGRIENRDALAFDGLTTMADWFWDAYHGAEPDFDLGGSASDAGVTGESDGAGVSGGRVGNDTGSAGTVNDQDSKPSRADRDNPTAGNEPTDSTSSRSAPHNTQATDVEDDHRGAATSSRSAPHNTQANDVEDDHRGAATSSRSAPRNTQATDVEDDHRGAATSPRPGSSDSSAARSEDYVSDACGESAQADVSADDAADTAERVEGDGGVVEMFDHVGGDDHRQADGINRAQRRNAGTVRKKRRPQPKQLPLIHVDLRALVRGRLVPGEVCEMPGAAPIGVDDARGLLPDAVVKLVLTDGTTDVRGVTHLGRGLQSLDLMPGASKPPARPTLGPPRYLVLVRLDAAALRVQPADDGPHDDLPGLGKVPMLTARTRLADWVLDRIITRGVDVGAAYQRRGLNNAQLVAALWSQPLCSVQGCNRYRVEYDHRHPWAKTSETALANIDPLCPHHHRLKSAKNWALVEGRGKRPMVPPTDLRHPHNVRHRRRQPAA